MRLDGCEMRRSGVPQAILEYLTNVAGDDPYDPIWSTAADIAYAVEANVGHVRRVLLELHRPRTGFSKEREMNYWKLLSGLEAPVAIPAYRYPGVGRWTRHLDPASLKRCRVGYHVVVDADVLTRLGSASTLWQVEICPDHDPLSEAGEIVTCRLKLMRRFDPSASLWGVWAADVAEDVLPIFEDARPGDDRPRLAIAAARSLAGDAARAARAAARDAARAAARDAAWAAGDAGAAARAAWAAGDAGAAARAAAWAAARAARAAGDAGAAAGAAARDAAWAAAGDAGAAAGDAGAVARDAAWDRYYDMLVARLEETGQPIT
jgi:hypothetical protein